LQKWVGRYNSLNKSSEKEWFKEESGAPKNVHRKTDSEIEHLVVNVRKSLLEGATEDTKYRCIGAVEIRFRMHELGYSEDDTPNLSTIKRIIKRNCLIVQKRKRYIRCKSKKRYTLLNPTKVTALGLALMHPMRSHLASNPDDPKRCRHTGDVKKRINSDRDQDSLPPTTSQSLRAIPLI
jgi:hypothetical protein